VVLQLFLVAADLHGNFVQPQIHGSH
jgi:hypothetical protein